MGNVINYLEPLRVVRVHIVGRYWLVGRTYYTSLEKIRKAYNHRCVIIIERK